MPRLNVGVLTPIILAVYLLSMYAVGFLTGNGYSVDLREPVVGKPTKLSLEDLGASYTHVAARVWGPAYEAQAVNATAQPLLVKGYHFTVGGLECERVVGTSDTYQCRGSGYILYPVGYREEFIRRGERTRYYYAGWLDAALYSIHQAYYSALLLAPIAAGLGVYALAKLGFRSARLLAVKAGLGAAAYAAGVVAGLREVPGLLAPYLHKPLIEASIVGIIAALGAMGLAFQAATGWRRRSLVENAA